MILSEGVLWEGTPAEFPGFGQIPRTNVPGWPAYWASYAEIYRRHLWVAAVVNKLAMGEARLPLKVYEHDDLNRPEARDHPYALLLRKPNNRHSRFFFWLWTVSTFDTYGEAFWGKLRDKGGRPIALVPLHPTGMHLDRETNGVAYWTFTGGAAVRITDIPGHDLVHFRTFNPDSSRHGMSRLEPLRRTLEFEDAAQRAQSAYWRKGARPGVLLSAPRAMSQGALDRLKVSWTAVAGGVDNTGETVVLEEGLKPEKWSLTAEEAQYIDSRKLNREEVCAVYDVPPPAVHILDRATFSNITEQLRSLYRDTHAPRLQLFESTLEAELRGGRRPGASDPDFGDDVYAEFLLDEVLRGDFEVRADAYQKADYMTVAEKRSRENLPFIEGTDRIMVNAATIPLDQAQREAPGAPQERPEAAAGSPGPSGTAAAVQRHLGAGILPESLNVHLRVLMGRLGRAKTLGDVEADKLTAGLGPAAPVVSGALELARSAGLSVAEFRDLLQSLAAGGPPS